ncbi:MAG: EAL domain-containing protein [Helicobacteraceae bacterium]|nr:EAL domain-containing protein [Helicobacteraceae bacterium]
MRAFVGLFLVTTFLFSFVFYFIYQKEYFTQEDQLFKQSDLLLQDISLMLQEELARISGDIFYLTSKYKKEHTKKEPITNELLDFMRYKTSYKKLHIFDLEGKELLIISSQNDEIILEDELDASPNPHLLYIQEALKLNEEEIYISKLNTQAPSTEPLLKVASPIFDQVGKKQGVLVLDISFDSLFDKLKNYTKHTKLNIFIANHDGEWIFPPQTQIHLFKGTNQVMDKSSVLWEEIQRYESAKVQGDVNTFYFKLFNPLKNIQHYDILHKDLKSTTLTDGFLDKKLEFILVVEIPQDAIVQRTWENVSKGVPYLIFGFFLVLVFLFLLLKMLQERIKNTAELKLAASCFENAEDGMVITDPTTKIIKVNKRYMEITGYDEEELIGQKTNILSSGWTPTEVYKSMWADLMEKNFWEGEITDRRHDGAVYSQWLRIITIRDQKENIVNFLGVTTDITERKKSEEKIKKLAYQDALTGLPNRTLFDDRLAKAIEVAKRYNRKLGLLFVDLDDFKLINDTSGHYIGDMFLMKIAETLKKSIRQSDTLARFGGDEFVIILEDYEKTDIVVISQRILDDLKEPLLINGIEYLPSASIGIAIFPDDAKDKIELLQHADTAMYKAKEFGKNNYCFYQLDMNVAINFRLSKERNLKKALEREELHLVFQPQISLQEKKVIGVEALLRWHNEELGMVPPDRFIHVAESLGLIIPFTDFVLKESCKAIKRFDVAGFTQMKVAVNISSLHIKKENFVSSVHQVVKQSGVHPKRIELEITEGALIENIEDTIEKLETLKSLGFSIAIDDFGTGYSSLSYLKKFNFDKLKIDREFVRHLPTDLDDISIIKAIIAVAKALNMRLIAEGAETEENIKFLEENHCDIIQGYFFSKPLKLEECLEFMASFHYSEYRT